MRTGNQTRFFVVILLAIIRLASAQTWVQTGAPSTNWQCIASSADGAKLAAIHYAGGRFVVYTSTNSGITWQNPVNGPTAIGITGSSSYIASSADGNKLLAAFTYSITAGGIGGMFISTNSGKDWIQTSTMNGASSVACSADGTQMATMFWGTIYTSTNSGATWISNNLTVFLNSIASSADWKKLIAATTLGYIYISTNSGATWTASGAPAATWSTVVTSVDGSKLAAVDTGRHGIYTSTNSGIAWTSNNVPTAQWSSIASSADGTKLVAVATDGFIYTSVNSGITWQSNSVPTNRWRSVTSSADGTKLAVVITGGGIYTSYITPKPSLNVTASNNSLAFSWVLASTNFVLQKSTNLAKATSWGTLTNTPILNLTNLQNQIILSRPSSNLFYRLKSP